MSKDKEFRDRVEELIRDVVEEFRSKPNRLKFSQAEFQSSPIPESEIFRIWEGAIHQMDFYSGLYAKGDATLDEILEMLDRGINAYGEELELDDEWYKMQIGDDPFDFEKKQLEQRVHFQAKCGQRYLQLIKNTLKGEPLLKVSKTQWILFYWYLVEYEQIELKHGDRMKFYKEKGEKHGITQSDFQNRFLSIRNYKKQKEEDLQVVVKLLKEYPDVQKEAIRKLEEDDG